MRISPGWIPISSRSGHSSEARHSSRPSLLDPPLMPVELVSPLAGWCLPLSEVPDPVFAESIMGPGVAIDPTGDSLCSPCNATILAVHPSGHAVTLITDDGLELLLHLGID